MTRTRCLVAMLAAIGISACEALPPTGLGSGNSSLQIFYDQVAFGYDSPDDSSLPVVSRWPDGATLAVEMRGGTAADSAEARRIFRDIETHTSLRYVWARGGEPDLWITFAPKDEWWCDPDAEQTGRTGVCCPVSRGGLGHLVEAIIFVQSDLSEVGRRYILRHELAHSTGLGFHTDREAASVLYNEWNEAIDFSSEDVFALETHYDPRVQPGMHRDSVHAALGWP